VIRGVLVADDHPIFRRGLRDVIDAHPGFRVVAEAGDGAEALRLLRETRPAIAVLDVSMPRVDGLEVLAQVAGWPERPATVLLTMHDDYAERAFQLGALGYLLKEHAVDELCACLDAIAIGRRFTGAGLPWQVGGGGDLEPASPLAALTATERRVLRLLADFKSSREIAEILSISHRTVQNHRANMCAKLGLGGAQALLRFAVAHRDAL
jgi:DNA-binding NarL/FixJ family response regulator